MARSHRLLTALGFVGLAAAGLRSENVTLTTAYPSPTAFYRNLTTTGQTVLARDNGNVLLAPPGTGTVALGTSSPANALRLDVRGPAGFAGAEVSVAGGNLVVQGGVVRPRGGLQVECLAAGSPRPTQVGRVWVESPTCP